MSICHISSPHKYYLMLGLKYLREWKVRSHRLEATYATTSRVHRPDRQLAKAESPLEVYHSPQLHDWERAGHAWLHDAERVLRNSAAPVICGVR